MKTTKTTKTTKTVRKHQPRVKTSAPACTKCGRVNTHGKDCRTKSACKARRAEQKTKGAARRGAAR